MLFFFWHLHLLLLSFFFLFYLQRLKGDACDIAPAPAEQQPCPLRLPPRILSRRGSCLFMTWKESDNRLTLSNQKVKFQENKTSCTSWKTGRASRGMIRDQERACIFKIKRYRGRKGAGALAGPGLLVALALTRFVLQCHSLEKWQHFFHLGLAACASAAHPVTSRAARCDNVFWMRPILGI